MLVCNFEYSRHLTRAGLCRLQIAFYPMLLCKHVSPTILPASSRAASWCFSRDELHRIWKPSSAEGQSGIVVQSTSSNSRLTLLFTFLLNMSFSVVPKCVHLVSLETSRLKPTSVCMSAQATPQATSEEVDQHLTQLAALAESSLAGALQTTHGKILCVPIVLHTKQSDA